MKRATALIITILWIADARAQLNTSADDYAPAFRSFANGRTELWFTSARATKQGRSRSIFMLESDSTCPANTLEVSSPINQSHGRENDVLLDGTPSFASCDPSHGVFTSNRTVNGKYFGTDIYEMREHNEQWTVTRLDAVCSNDWDDSPALSADGTRLYFSSDRLNPGNRTADLFISTFESGAWTKPRPLDAINTTEFSEETPFVGDDGYLYYSSNKTGDYDIYRVHLTADGMPSGTPEAMPYDAINFKGSDETHPCISPGGSFFLFSTNAGANGRKKDFDIRWVRSTSEQAQIELDTRKRRHQSTEHASVLVHFTTNGYEKIIRSPVTGPMQLKPDDFLPESPSPMNDPKFFQTILRAEPDSGRFISAVDTIVSSRLCRNTLQHTLFLWDTSVYYEPSCIDTFPIKKVQYFVTGYWCPTTKRFAKYEDCPTLFIDSACEQPPCTNNDLYSFKITTDPTHSECIDYNEFDTKGKQFATDVDDAIDEHLKAMESAFGSACLRRAVAKRKPVQVVVEGFTDPRGYGSDCHYFGATIDFTKSFVQVPDTMKSHFRHDTPMKKYGYGGNQLLSELRAYNLAVLLDNLWTEQIAQYRELKASGLLTVLAVGRAVDQHDIPFDRRRSAEVRISSFTDEPIVRTEVPEPGATVVVCEDCR
ncbi:MAG: PD40 domain-containing protein [Bacteroidetes bacterium]|nr:PD40 domain-containing protein [Bacteroidota bacterium]